MPSSTLLSSVALPAVAHATHALCQPLAVHAGALSEAVSVRELRDGHVIVSDPRTRALHVLDTQTSRATKIGSVGVRSGEWGAAGRLLPLPGDVTLMVDDANDRFFIIGSNGKPAPHLRPYSMAFGRGRVPRAIAMDMMNAHATDARGRLYYEGHSTDARATAGGERIPIVRFDPGNGTHDTVAHISADGAVSNRGGFMRHGPRLASATHPFAPSDEWTVLPDGRVALVRARDYNVVIIQNRQRVATSAPVAFTPIRVSEADKEQFRALRRVEHRVLSLSRSANPVVHPPEPAEWPDIKPPFAPGAVWSTTEGRIVVVRSRAAGDHVPTADVFGARGEFAGTLVLPPHAHVAGFGMRCIYLNRRDATGVQHLEKYALPGFACGTEMT